MTLNRKETEQTNWWIMGGFTAFVTMLVISGIIGLFALKKTSYDIRRYMDAIDNSRDIQVRFQEQFHRFTSIMRGNGDFEGFKKNYHVFSYKADRIQDDFFNLGILCSSLSGSREKIRHVSGIHKALTAEFIASINLREIHGGSTHPVNSGYSEEKVNSAIAEMESLVNYIRIEAEREISHVDSVYSSIVFVSLILLTGAGISMSFYVARKLMTFHSRLEVMVLDRTHDLVRVNKDLESEISERKKAEVMLSESIKELEEANRRIGLSEEKYRRIVEGSDALIFALDEEFRFVSANRTVDKYFKIKPDSILTRNLLDLIHEGEGAHGLSRALVEEKLRMFHLERSTIAFFALFKTPAMIEPIEMNVRLQYIEIEGKSEILGEATGILDDELLKYLTYERQRFSMASSIGSADDITYRLTRNLAKHCDQKEVLVMRIALREMIVNAIEHGNFSISFNEKSRALDENRYFQLLASRRGNPRYGHKRVHIEYLIDDRRVIYKISDEGSGFDHNKVLNTDMDALNDSMLSHGRGIAMARSVFDEIRYNKPGNQVLLIKRFSSPA